MTFATESNRSARAASPGLRSAAGRHQGDAHTAELLDDVATFVERCRRLCDATSSPFLNASWLGAWYAALGNSHGRRPVLVAVRSEASGADVLLLPLVSRRVAGLSVVEFADGGIGDYNLPAFDLTLQDLAAAQSVWKAVRRALRGHDAIRLEKMLTRTLDDAGAAVNPLCLALPGAACELQGNQARAGDDWDAWRQSLGKHVRKEFERCWRVFTRSPGARFERIADAQTALQAFVALESQQTARMREGGRRYVLDEPVYADVYRRALLAGIDDGSVVVTALFDGDAVVAVQFGIANRRRWISLRLSTAGGAWAPCSPGRLLLERTAAHLHAQGVRWFDFGIGDYAHKTVFGVDKIPMIGAMASLSWRGRPLVWLWRLRGIVKRRPRLVRLVRVVRTAMNGSEST